MDIHTYIEIFASIISSTHQFLDVSLSWSANDEINYLKTNLITQVHEENEPIIGNLM
jgi:hypothetical protein